MLKDFTTRNEGVAKILIVYGECNTSQIFPPQHLHPPSQSSSTSAIPLYLLLIALKFHFHKPLNCALTKHLYVSFAFNILLHQQGYFSLFVMSKVGI